MRNSPLLGAYFETFAFGQLLRSLHNQGKADEIYYYRDKDGHEVDFLIPQGNQVCLYECKWNDESGTLPKNVAKIVKIIGRNNIAQITTVTTAARKTELSKRFNVTNIVEL